MKDSLSQMAVYSLRAANSVCTRYGKSPWKKLISHGRAKSLLVLCLLGVLLQALPAATFSTGVLKPELNYLPVSSFLQENYTDPPAEPFIHVQDSVYWSAPITSMPAFWHFWREIFAGNDRSYLASQYAINNQDLDFVSRFHFEWGYEAVQLEHGNYGMLHMLYRNQAEINQNWFIYGETWMGNYFGNLDQAETSPLLDSWHKPPRGLLANQNFTGGIQYSKKWFNAELGRGRFALGDNISSSIILNDLTNDYAFTKLEMTLGKVNFVLLNGQLVADSTMADPANPLLTAKTLPDKYFSLHYMDWVIGNTIKMFIGDIAVYGNRSFDLNYVFPHSFVRVVERNQHDRDNLLMYVGGTWKPQKPLLLYGQLMLDELIVDKIAGNWWGNKYAVQGGISYQLPLFFATSQAAINTQPTRNPQISMEFTAVRPWTYTHNLLYNKYSHDNRGLGYQYGSNLLNYAMQLKLPIAKLTECSAYYSYTRQGSLGNDYSLNYGSEIDDLQSTTADWLQGEITDTWRVEHSFKIHPWAHQRFRLSHQVQKENSHSWKQTFSLAWQMII